MSLCSCVLLVCLGGAQILPQDASKVGKRHLGFGVIILSFRPSLFRTFKNGARIFPPNLMEITAVMVILLVHLWSFTLRFQSNKPIFIRVDLMDNSFKTVAVGLQTTTYDTSKVCRDIQLYCGIKLLVPRVSTLPARCHWHCRPSAKSILAFHSTKWPQTKVRNWICVQVIDVIL